MTIHARFYEAIRYLFPNAKLTGPYRSRDVRLTNDGSGPIISVWNIPAPVPTYQEILDALAAVDATASTKNARTTAFNNDPDRNALVAAVKNATPAQIKTYINNNVNSLATARDMLIKLTLLVAMTLRD